MAVKAKAGKGFYEYPENGEKHLWPELTNLFPPNLEQPSQQDLVDRLMFIQANESAKCYQEDVVRSVADTNVGSIFGWGFAPQHGGTLQFINSMGAKKFVERSRELAEQYGDRFSPAQIVVDMAEKARSLLMPNTASSTAGQSTLNQMADCLQGLRVVDLTRNLPGPLRPVCLPIWEQISSRLSPKMAILPAH